MAVPLYFYRIYNILRLVPDKEVWKKRVRCSSELNPSLWMTAIASRSSDFGQPHFQLTTVRRYSVADSPLYVSSDVHFTDNLAAWVNQRIEGWECNASVRRDWGDIVTIATLGVSNVLI